MAQPDAVSRLRRRHDTIWFLRSAMNWLDLVILLVLAWFTIAGTTAGFPREAVTFLAMLAGVVLAGLLHGRLADDFGVFTENDRLARVIGFLAIFLAAWGAGQIATVVFKTQALSLTFGPFDRPGGLILGLAKGVILIESVLVLFSRYQFQTMDEAIGGSFLAPFFLEAIPFIRLLLPGEFDAADEPVPAAPP